MPSTSLRASRLTTVAAASGAINWLNRASWRLFDAAGNLSPLVTSTRTGTATFFDSTGTLQNAAANTPRVSFDPANLSLGRFLLAEEARTNSIRNNTMQGAVAGTLPTNWQKGEAGGLTVSVVGAGTTNGIAYTDFRISGTATSTSSSTVQFEQNSAVSSSNGQTWTLSAYVQIVGGTTSGISAFRLAWEERSTVFLAVVAGNSFTPQSGGIFAGSRVPFTGVNGNAATTFIKPYFQVTPTNGAAIDITLRIGLPQLELGATASSPILTYGTAVTRSADSLSVTNLAATGFNAAEGTLYAEFGPYGAGAAQGNSGNFGILSISDGTFQNGHMLFAGSGISPVYNPRVGNASSAYISAGTLSPGSRNRIAASYSASGFARSHNGNAPTVSASAPLPTGLTVMNIARLPAIVGNLDGRIYQAAIIPTRVSDSGLQRMTRI